MRKEKSFNLKDSLIYNPISSEKNITWGGNEYDFVTDLVIDSLNNIYLTGYSKQHCEDGSTRSFGNLIKFNRFGTVQWNHSWTGNQSEYFYSLDIDSSDNIYLGGITSNFIKEYNESLGVRKDDIILIKFDNLGVQQWNRTWGGNYTEYCLDITLDTTDNIYLLGITDIFDMNFRQYDLIKYNGIGVEQWSHTWLDNLSIGFIKISLDSKGNIYLAGNIYYSESSDADICIAKYNRLGIQQWFKTWGDDNNRELFSDMILDSKGSIYILANLEKEGNYDICLVGFNSSGDYQWNHIWGGVEYDEGSSLALDSFENIYIAGTTYSFITGYYGYPDICVLKYDNKGRLLWNRTWGDNQREFSHAIGLDSDNNIYIAGEKFFFGRKDCDILLVIIPNGFLIIIPRYDLLLIFFIVLICIVSSILIVRKWNLHKIISN